MTSPDRLVLSPLPGIPIVQKGDDLPALILAGCRRASLTLGASDVVVVAQKVVSKAEGRMVALADVVPSTKAVALAYEVKKDARLVELILSESKRVVRARPGVLIVEHRLGFVMANAGVDQSNVAPKDGTERALLLPLDPDASALRLRNELHQKGGTAPAVIINDSFGRPWRNGTVGVAIGAAGLPSLMDLRGKPDMFGRTLVASLSAFADEVASAASLVMGQADEARPIVVVQGLSWGAASTPASALLRPAEEDLFR